MRRLLLLLAVAGGALFLAPGALAGAWCGGGEPAADQPDVVTGRQIHAFVVVPSDGADTFATSAAQIQTDADAVDAWWTGQDPTRVPRFDLAAFSGVNCLDITFLRLSVPASALTGADTVFDTIVGALAAGGFFNVYKRDVVYYDGPAPELDVCGVGGGTFESGPALAVVMPTGCPGVPTDTVLAHELLHALGALPAGAPHACPGDSGHPCDSPSDILYPFTRGEPLSQKVLDVNHDDYYGHSGNWNDIQDSLWLRRLNVPLEDLAVSLSGAGTVTSDVPGVACTATCTTQWEQGSALGLVAAPADGTRFIGWKGACTGSGGCLVTLDAPQSATAVFGPLHVSVKARVQGKGRVVCSPVCSATFEAGTPVSLRAVPAKGWRFAAWSGSCKGTRPTCSPNTDFGVAAKATFKRKR